MDKSLTATYVTFPAPPEIDFSTAWGCYYSRLRNPGLDETRVFGLYRFFQIHCNSETFGGWSQKVTNILLTNLFAGVANAFSGVTSVFSWYQRNIQMSPLSSSPSTGVYSGAMISPCASTLPCTKRWCRYDCSRMHLLFCSALLLLRRFFRKMQFLLKITAKASELKDKT